MLSVFSLFIIHTQKKREGGYLMIFKGKFCLFLHKNLCCGCSLESPRQGDSNEHPQHRFLAHLSRRLIGELIVYQWSGVRRRRPSSASAVVVRPQCSNIFFSETAWPIKAKFYVEPPWVGGTKFCSRHLGHMTKMAATPIYGKNPSKIFFSRTGRPIFTKLGM